MLEKSNISLVIVGSNTTYPYPLPLNMSQNKKFLVFENPHNLTNYLLKRWIELSVNAVKQGSKFTAALSGGKTHIEFYCKLAGLSNMDLWDKCHLFLTDERFVPSDNQDSNYAMLKRNLFDYINIPLDNIHPINTACENAQISAEIFQKDITKFFGLTAGELPAFDFLLLGVGTDGHVASLFPGFSALDLENKLVTSYSNDTVKNARVSLVLPVLNKARNIFVVVTGDEKAGIVKSIFEERFVCPASMMNPIDGHITYLMDTRAVSTLSDETKYIDEEGAVSLKYFQHKE